MLKRMPRRGFTLIEVLMVVVMMAILAAALVPLFASSSNDAREGSLRSNLQSLRTQIEIYRLQHLGAVPDGTLNLRQLTVATDASGTPSVSGSADAAHPFGPYVQNALPPQAFSGLNSVKL